MSETTTCGACGMPQAAGSAFCAICGTAFPRTGQAPAGSSAPRTAPFREPGIAITTEREVAAMTQRASDRYPTTSGTPARSGLAASPVAGVGRRVVAYLIDTMAIVLVVAAVLVGGVSAAGVPLDGTIGVVSPAEAQELLGRVLVVYALAAVVSLAYWLTTWIWEGRTGKTLGNLAMGLRTVRAEGRTPLGFGRAALRWLLLGVGQILVAISPAFDASGLRQGWQDKAAKSLVLTVRAGATGHQKDVRAQGFAAPDAAVPAGYVAPAGYGAPAGHSAPAGYAAPVAHHARSASAPVGYGAPVAPAQGVMSGPQSTGHGPVDPAPHPVGDPWSFPVSAPASASSPSSGVGAAGLITGIPGTAPVSGSSGAATSGMVAPPSGTASTIRKAPLAPTPSRPAVVVTSPPTLAADEDPDWDSTRFSVSELRRGRSPVASATGFVLELESGRRVHVVGRTLLGRNPQPTGAADEALISIEDPTRSVSKTHVEMGVDQGELWLVDRGSTNGTILLRPHGAPQLLEAGSRVAVPVGSVIQVGDRRVTVTSGTAS